MTKLPRGLYELLLTEALAESLGSLGPEHHADLINLRSADAADRIALHCSRILERALEKLPEDTRTRIGVELARHLIDKIVEKTNTKALIPERPTDVKVLQSIRARLLDGSFETVAAPLIPLIDTALLTNAPDEPRVGHQIQAEIASADRIDLVMAFIRRSGMLAFREELRRHAQAGRQLRILTTTYTGSTELEALEMLTKLGVHVRVSYDTSTTRLHAKAWLFHRDSGFSTAYVGSSNLTHSAQHTGLEWNVRVSAARNRAVIEKIAAVFDTYWEQEDFEDFDPERFTKAVAPSDRNELTISPIEVRLEPFQERLLEQIELSREAGHHRNLLVSATGTGKTVMAAVDYAHLKARLPRARLLFVAHREEILEQGRATFRQVLRDGKFGEAWVGRKRPKDFEHVFASIQSLNTGAIDRLDPNHFDVIIIDEFHHAAAKSYVRLINKVDPVELLGLTATPERSDDEPILHWFGDRIAAELRLWDAIDQHRLTPFTYYGIADELDLTDVPWTRGKGYDVEQLTGLITGTKIWARKVLSELTEHVGRIDQARCLGFCVSVEHAKYMARVFSDAGVSATAIWADTPDDERKAALADLAAARVNVVFSVDLFNEGVDVPSVDTLLMLRPTESPLLFLQQLGRGLRKSSGKTACTVLDFVGQHRKEFRYDRRFQGLLGGSRASVIKQIESGFPYLPAGCHMELDRLASERVIRSIKNSVPSTWAAKAAELRALSAEQPNLGLREFLAFSGLDLDDVYSSKRSWSDLQEAAGLDIHEEGPEENTLRRACARLLHVDDAVRLNFWRDWVQKKDATSAAPKSDHERRLVTMLLTQLLDQVATQKWTLKRGIKLLWRHPQVRAELLDLFSVLTDRIAHVSKPLSILPTVPLRVNASYTRLEILAACGITKAVKGFTWQTGVLFAEDLPADLLIFTLNKTSGAFSPTTRYRDYAISRELIHWESQSVARAKSETGQRYQHHESRGSHVLLFARHTNEDRSFYFLGPAKYVNHKGELPMAVTWKLENSLPGDLFASFAAAVA